MNFKTLLFLSTLASISFSGPLQASDPSLTPPVGSPLRKEVLDALRNEVKTIHGIEVVFVVRYFRVKDGWAWTHTLPQSPDGANRYEDISALLRFRDEAWEVVDMPCGEEGNPDCLDEADYFKRLEAKYPSVAIEVFPDSADDAGK